MRIFFFNLNFFQFSKYGKRHERLIWTSVKGVLHWSICRMIFGSMPDLTLKTRNFCNVLVASLSLSTSITLNTIFAIILDPSPSNATSAITPAWTNPCWIHTWSPTLMFTNTAVLTVPTLPNTATVWSSTCGNTTTNQQQSWIVTEVFLRELMQSPRDCPCYRREVHLGDQGDPERKSLIHLWVSLCCLTHCLEWPLPWVQGWCPPSGLSWTKYLMVCLITPWFQHLSVLSYLLILIKIRWCLHHHLALGLSCQETWGHHSSAASAHLQQTFNKICCAMSWKSMHQKTQTSFLFLEFLQKLCWRNKTERWIFFLNNNKHHFEN